AIVSCRSCLFVAGGCRDPSRIRFPHAFDQPVAYSTSTTTDTVSCPPQSPRQALLKLFMGISPNQLEKHLPSAAKKAFQRPVRGKHDVLKRNLRAGSARESKQRPPEHGDRPHLAEGLRTRTPREGRRSGG